MTKADIVNEIAKSTGIEKIQVMSVVEEFTKVVKDSLIAGEPFAFSRLLKWQTRGRSAYFFLCRFLRKRFLRLCVAILCLFLFLPLGII